MKWCDPASCVTCGFPSVRPDGHANWCEEQAAFNRGATARAMAAKAAHDVHSRPTVSSDRRAS